MSSNPAEWNLKVNLTGLREELAKIPGITEAEAKKMTVALAQQFKETERAAKAAAKANKEAGDSAKKAAKEAAEAQRQAAEEARKWEAGLRGVEKAGRIVGGPIGDLTDLLGDTNDVIEGAGTGMGKFGAIAGVTVGTLTALAGAVIGGYKAMDRLAESTRSAIERLDEIDGARKASLAARAALEQWDKASLKLEASTALVTAEMGERFLPTAAEMVETVSKSIDGYRLAADALEPWGDGLENLGRIMKGLASGGMTEVAGKINELRGALLGTGKQLSEGADKEERAAERQKELTEEQARVAAQKAKDAMAWDKIRHEQSLLALADAEAEMIALADIEAGKKAQAEADQRRAEAARERRQEEEKAEREQAARREKYERAILRGRESDLRIAEQKREDEARALKEEEKRAQEAAEAQRDAFRQATDTIIGSVGDAAGALMGMVEEGSTAYKVLFAMQKGAAIAGITVDTARSVMAALTIPPPAGPALATANAIAGAAQLGIAVATSFAPKAHSGSSGIAPDEQVILKSESRGILAGLGMAAAGGPAGVAAMNRGEPPAAAGGGIAVLQFRNRVFDSPIAEMGRLPGTALHAIKRDGRRPGMRPRPARIRRL